MCTVQCHIAGLSAFLGCSLLLTLESSIAEGGTKELGVNRRIAELIGALDY
jgi:hypothetical protein